MILLSTTSDLLRVITGTAKTIDVHTSWVDMSTADPPVIKGSTSGRDNVLITTATTTTIVPAPAASTVRNVKSVFIRNRDATACDITVVHSDGTDIPELVKCTLLPNKTLQLTDEGKWEVVNVGDPIVTSVSVADQAISAATLTLITGSLIAVPVTAWQIGLTFRWEMYIDKTAAGTLASTIFVRAGTAGTTADGIVAQFSTGTGTAAIDTGVFDILFTVRTVGASATAISNLGLIKNAGTIVGWSVLPTLSVNGTMSAFNTTTATFISVSITSGTSVAPTVRSCIGRVI